MPPLGGADVADEEHLYFFQDPWTKVNVLGSTIVLEEMTWLCGDGEQWAADIDNGAMFIYRVRGGPEEVHLAADLYLQIVKRLEDRNGLPNYTIYDTHTEKTIITCQADRERDLRDIKIPILPQRRLDSFTVAVFKRPRADGCKIMWAMPSVYTTLGFTQYGGKRCIWSSHVLQQLPHTVGVEAGLGEEHFARSARIGKTRQGSRDHGSHIAFPCRLDGRIVALSCALVWAVEPPRRI